MGPLEGKRVLVSRPKEQAKPFADRLSALGAETIPLPQETLELDSQPDYITLTSSSDAKSTLTGLEREKWLRDAKLVCIGPVTAATVRDMGYEVAATAEDYTTDGIIKALVSLATEEPEDE